MRIIKIMTTLREIWDACRHSSLEARGEILEINQRIFEAYNKLMNQTKLDLYNRLSNYKGEEYIKRLEIISDFCSDYESSDPDLPTFAQLAHDHLISLKTDLKTVYPIARFLTLPTDTAPPDPKPAPS